MINLAVHPPSETRKFHRDAHKPREETVVSHHWKYENDNVMSVVTGQSFDCILHAWNQN